MDFYSRIKYYIEPECCRPAACCGRSGQIPTCANKVEAFRFRLLSAFVFSLLTIMSANDYYNAGKPQQGGYYPPQGTAMFSCISEPRMLRRRSFLRHFVAHLLPQLYHPIVFSSLILETGGPPAQGGYYPQVRNLRFNQRAFVELT